MGKVLLVITTESNRKLAKGIAKFLIKKKLAACVSLKDIYSIYKWNGKIEKAKEVEIIIKSKPELKAYLKDLLQEMISYDTPQIIYKLFNSEKKYLNWISKSVSNEVSLY